MTKDSTMSCSVDVDELYVDGRDKNKHADKRGEVKKMTVAEIRHKKTGQVAATPVPATTASHMEHFIGCMWNWVIWCASTRAVCAPASRDIVLYTTAPASMPSNHTHQRQIPSGYC